MLGALPGIREIRSALAGGYLWITFLWLALDPHFGKSSFKGEPFQSAHHLGNDIGPVALGVTLTFAAYLIGTFFNEMRGVIARIYLTARQSASGKAPAESRAENFERMRQRRRERRRLRRQMRLRRLQSRREKREQIADTWRSSPRPSVANFSYRAGRAFIEAATMLDITAEGLLRLPAFLAEDTMDGVDALQERVLTTVRQISSVRIEPYKPFVSEEGVAAIARYLDYSQRKRSGYKFGGGSGIFAKGPAVADVIADFPIIRTRLIQESPDTVSEYDRLQAEADFRSAIVPPLFAILLIFVIKISWLWSLAALILLVLIVTARQKRREAGDILADTLGVVEAPCVEEAARQQASRATFEADLLQPGEAQ